MHCAYTRYANRYRHNGTHSARVLRSDILVHIVHVDSIYAWCIYSLYNGTQMGTFEYTRHISHSPRNMLHPRNPPNQETQIPRCKFKLNKNHNLNWYREIPRNLCFSMWQIVGVEHVQCNSQVSFHGNVARKTFELQLRALEKVFGNISSNGIGCTTHGVEHVCTK